MPDQTPYDDQPAPEQPAEPEWQRRRRLAAVFGDVLPETTSDERAPETPAEASDEDAGDRWLRSQVPPHHG
jgi:hypothetical protein